MKTHFYSSLSKLTSIEKYKNTGVEKEIDLEKLNGKKENISRLDFSLGIRIYL
jgi:hypothetical protein